MKNKHSILITGSGSGLGEMAALELAKRGHKVYATALYDSEITRLNELAKKENINLISFKLDITDENDRNKIRDIEFDTLINNAAIGDSGSLAEVSIDRIKNIFHTNVFSNLELTQIAIKKFVEQGYGKVIFISSLAGRVAIKFLGPYSMSKFTIESIAECLRKEIKDIQYADITIKLIEPGAYATGFNKENNEKKYEWMKQKSYFKFMLDNLKTKEEWIWNFIESKNYKSIVKKYVKAVEDNNKKFRYSAPFLQTFITHSRIIFS